MSAPTLNPVVAGPPALKPGQRPVQRALLWTGGVIGAVLIAWSAVQVADRFATSTETRGHEYPAARTVELVADGQVTVTVGADDKILVTERNRSGFGSSEFSANRIAGDGESKLSVSSRCAAAWWWSANCEAGLEVTVPSDTAVVVRSLSGDVQVRGVSGDVLARSGSGQVLVDGGRQVEARSSNGDVAVVAAQGSVTATSGSGRVEVEDVAGDVEAKSSNGQVEVRFVSGDVSADSGSGHVEVDAARGDIEATSSNGDVTVRGVGEPVQLTIVTGNGNTTLEGATDPKAQRSVVIRSGSGNVAYLGPR